MPVSIIKALARHLSVGLLGFTTMAAPWGAPQAQEPGATSRFFVTFRGVRIGSETVTVTRGDGAVTISARGQIAPPIDLVTTKFEMIYSADWQPRKLTIEGAMRNQTLMLATSFGLTTAISDVTQGSTRGSTSHDISPRTIVLPPSFFAAYEVLAARLPSFQVGARFPVFIAPEGEIGGVLNKVTPRRIVNPSGTTDLREYSVTLDRPGMPMTVLVSVDSRNRLAKVIFGEQGYAAIREDISTVMSREVKVHNPGDSDTFIPATGFSLAATVTAPQPAPARMPAVVLVGSQGSQDRDETRYGISIFGQMAGRLAEAGYFVVRYDKRGIGQSGGRPEHAGVLEYADDVVSIVKWLKARKDIDPKRIVLLSHGDGDSVVLTAAAKSKDVRGVALVGGSGMTGRETVLAQQKLVLDRLNSPASEREAQLAMERRVIDAVITGKGWELVPPDIRHQSDTAWFKTWLLFDPAVALKTAAQPLLIVHGELDREIPASNADLLERLGTARKASATTTTHKTIVPGVNHLLLAAKTGDPDEYDSLPEQTISPAIVAALVTWLNQTIK
jgi:pimeloyl-ACP methyl ester carboxylesterase